MHFHRRAAVFKVAAQLVKIRVALSACLTKRPEHTRTHPHPHPHTQQAMGKCSRCGCQAFCWNPASTARKLRCELQHSHNDSCYEKRPYATARAVTTGTTTLSQPFWLKKPLRFPLLDDKTPVGGCWPTQECGQFLKKRSLATAIKLVSRLR